MNSLSLVIIGLLFLAGLYLILNASRRRSSDVLFDLANADDVGSAGGPMLSEAGAAGGRARLILGDELAGLGLYEHAERARCRLVSRLLPLGVAAAGFLLCLASGSRAAGGMILVLISGAALGYLADKIRLNWLRAEHVRQLEFYLPVVMERVVMAVQAGLDVVAALKRVIELERMTNGRLDPVSRLMNIVCRFAESGLSVEKSLQEVAGMVKCTAIRHAFIHLAMAYKEGGELVMPLTELSDSTQLYFQESVEEEIAKMPVKATMPLVLTFGGLIVCFIATPMIQVMEMIGKAMPH